MKIFKIMFPVIALLAVGTGCANKNDVNNNDVSTSDTNNEYIEGLFQRCMGMDDTWRAQGASCCSLGIEYQNGVDVKQDFIKAKFYFEKSCNLNDDLGCLHLGYSYYNGRGGEQSFRKALQYFEKSCKLGNQWGCFNAGIIYVDGQGVRQDKSKAKEYFGKTCDLGKKEGCDNYRTLNEQGY